jgi:hypothetical protein
MRKLLVALAMVAASVALSAVFAARSSGSRGLDKLSNAGVPVTDLSPAGVHALRLLGATQLRLLGQVGQRRFFRLEMRGSSCFAAGDVEIGASTPTDVYCPHGAFPTASLPVYDDPAVEMSRDDPGGAHLLSLDGLAADGVERVQLVRDGQVIASSRVAGNIFSLAVDGVEITGTRLVARDGGGNVVFSRVYSSPPS